MKKTVSACAMIVLAGVLLAGCAGKPAETVTDTVALDAFDTLEIDVSSYAVTVTVGDSYALEYSAEKGSEPKTEQNGSRLKVSQPSRFLSMFRSGGEDKDSYYKITIPEGSNPVSLEAKASSGEFMLDRVKVSGTIKTDSGSVMLNDVEGRIIEAETVSGEIDGDKVKGGAVSFGTSSGAVQMLRVESDDLSINSSSGAISVNNSAARNVMCQTTSGDVDVELLGPKDTFSYYVDTSSGNVTVNGETVDKEYVKDDGSDGKVAVHTSSGNINVELSGQ